MSSLPLAGKYALVTGASRGIGAAIALELARKGAAGVAITYLGSKDRAQEVAEQIVHHGAKAAVIQADLLNVNYGTELVKKALEKLETDTLDIVVNNAALVDKANEAFGDISLQNFNAAFQGNVFGAIATINAALPHLPSRGGRIINISSISSREPCPDPLMTYGASKAALESFTRSLAGYYAAEKRATFNSVSVGPTLTDAMKNITGNMPQDVIEQFRNRQTAEHRFAEPEDVALVVAWLAGEEARWINGASVAANGGGMIAAQG